MCRFSLSYDLTSYILSNEVCPVVIEQACSSSGYMHSEDNYEESEQQTIEKIRRATFFVLQVSTALMVHISHFYGHAPHRSKIRCPYCGQNASVLSTRRTKRSSPTAFLLTVTATRTAGRKCRQIFPNHVHPLK